MDTFFFNSCAVSCKVFALCIQWRVNINRADNKGKSVFYDLVELKTAFTEFVKLIIEIIIII